MRLAKLSFVRSLFLAGLLLLLVLSVPHEEIKTAALTDQQVQQMYDKLWRATGEKEYYVPLVIASDDMVNAYATYTSITVFKGLINSVKSEDELAFVLSHEISHVLLGHVDPVKENDAKGDNAIMHDEVKADKYGAFIMMKAGYDICKGREIFYQWTIDMGNVLTSTHPCNIYRYNELNINCGKV